MYHGPLGSLTLTGGTGATLAATGFTDGGILLIGLAAFLAGILLLRYAFVDMNQRVR